MARIGLAGAVALFGAAALSAADGDGTAPARSPEALYEASCAYCHGPGGWGTRALARRVPAGQEELLRRTDLPAALVRIAVRRGVGSMPQLTPTDLSDEELGRLARWLDERQ
jgi:mono/diheme cytochrome c family protein